MMLRMKKVCFWVGTRCTKVSSKKSHYLFVTLKIINNYKVAYRLLAVCKLVLPTTKPLVLFKIELNTVLIKLRTKQILLPTD